MKIIYRGTLPEERKYTGTCLNCGSMYEAIEKELRYCPPPPFLVKAKKEGIAAPAKYAAIQSISTGRNHEDDQKGSCPGTKRRSVDWEMQAL